jgi:hypothetical protein
MDIERSIIIAKARAERAINRGDTEGAAMHAADAGLLIGLAAKGVTTARHPAVVAARRERALSILNAD